MRWDEQRYYSFSYWVKHSFGQKVYKASLDGGMTCPNRDGSLGNSGCIFCSEGGSGDYAADARLPVFKQIEQQKRLLGSKNKSGKYIAYFQAFTNTYAPLPYLKELYSQALAHPDVVALSIGTRPDCINREIVEMIASLTLKKPIWIELGLQTIHPKTAAYIRRGYDLPVFYHALKLLKEYKIGVVTHLILGLPGEGSKEVLETVRYLNDCRIDGIKFHLLHVLKNTDLAKDYEQNKFQILTKEAYIELLKLCIGHLSPDIVIHRLTGDGPKELLIAPLWSLNKRGLLNDFHRALIKDDLWQGKFL